MAIGDQFSAGLFQPQQGVYDSWLRSQAGLSPLAYSFGQFNQPLAQLQYMTDPITSGWTSPAAGVSPFREFLGGYSPLAGGGRFNQPIYDDPMATSSASRWGTTPGSWLERAESVRDALRGATQGGDLVEVPGGNFGNEALERLRQRFGMEGGAEAAANAVRLAQAPVLSRSPLALRGETQSILDRSYQDWLAKQAVGDPGSYLGSTGGAEGLWKNWGIMPA